MNKHDKSADLLSILRQKGSPQAAPPRVQERTSSQYPSPTPAAPRKVAPVPHRTASKAIRGKALHFYLHAEDEKLIRELAVWLAPHRKRINDSLVIKAVLRTAKTGAPLLAAYDEAVKVDGRIRAK